MDVYSPPTTPRALKEAEAYGILLMQEVEMEEKDENLISGRQPYSFVWYRMPRLMFVLTLTDISSKLGARGRLIYFFCAACNSKVT